MAEKFKMAEKQFSPDLSKLNFTANDGVTVHIHS
jgi:hypothetical protein